MDKILNKMNKELVKLNKNINNLTEQKDEVILDIKNKTEYKKKLEQSVNSLKMIETSDTKKMIENIQKEATKIEVAIEDLKDKKDNFIKDLKAATDVYKRLENYKATYTEFVESLNKTEDVFFNVLDSYNESNKKKKDKKEDRNEQDLDVEKISDNSDDSNNRGMTENTLDYKEEGNNLVYLNNNNGGFRF